MQKIAIAAALSGAVLVASCAPTDPTPPAVRDAQQQQKAMFAACVVQQINHLQPAQIIPTFNENTSVVSSVTIRTDVLTGKLKDDIGFRRDLVFFPNSVNLREVSQTIKIGTNQYLEFNTDADKMRPARTAYETRLQSVIQTCILK